MSHEPRETGMPKPQRHRIWALACPFNKQGSPVVGSFGSRIRSVVIMPVETWTKLCQEHPTLQTTEFEVGTYD